MWDKRIVKQLVLLMAIGLLLIVVFKTILYLQDKTEQFCLHRRKTTNYRVLTNFRRSI